jgi:hypothetical protein
MAKRGRNGGKKPANENAKSLTQAPGTGQGGEIHQVAGGDVPILTTQQGTSVSDDQNSLRIGARGPTVLEDFITRAPRLCGVKYRAQKSNLQTFGTATLLEATLK